MKITRRGLIGAASAALAATALSRPSSAAAEFEFKLGVNTPETHPLTVRLTEAAHAIGAQSSGRLNVTVFPNSQLGGDPEMLSQVRAGGIELLAAPSMTLSTLVPLSGLPSVGFAFGSYDQVWAAMDGGVGEVVRDAIGRAGIVPMKKMWDNGFRQITSSTHPIKGPADLKGFKIRVPVSPLWTSMFQALGASPISINFSEVYSALQTRIAEGQENPLSLIEIAKLYEVQKYVSMTSHMWDGFWMLANKRGFSALPPDAQVIVARELNKSALEERADIATLNGSVAEDLKSKGLTFVEVDKPTFREALKTAGFYADWKKKYGDEAWGILESEVGVLS